MLKKIVRVENRRIGIGHPYMQTPSSTTELHEFCTEPTSEGLVVIWKLVSSRLALGMMLRRFVAIYPANDLNS